MINPISFLSFYCLRDIPLHGGFVQFFISPTFHPSLSNILFQILPGIPDYTQKCPMFSTTQSYAPNVIFLLAVSMNTHKSCHSKQQHFTAHKLHSPNKFNFYNCNVSHSVPPFHDTDGLTPSAPAMYHVTHSVQLAQSVKAIHPASCNAAGLPASCNMF